MRRSLTPTQKRESVSFLMLFHVKKPPDINIAVAFFRICQNENGEIPEKVLASGKSHKKVENKIIWTIYSYYRRILTI